MSLYNLKLLLHFIILYRTKMRKLSCIFYRINLIYRYNMTSPVERCNLLTKNIEAATFDANSFRINGPCTQ